MERSSRLRHNPKATRSEEMAKIGYLRERFRFVPLKIALDL